jgi:hypothetical protein
MSHARGPSATLPSLTPTERSGAKIQGVKHGVEARVAVRIGLCRRVRAAADARAQNYPTKPIRMIVPFPAGGPIDVMGRITGDRLSQGVGQTVVIENRPGRAMKVSSSSV